MGVLAPNAHLLRDTLCDTDSKRDLRFQGLHDSSGGERRRYVDDGGIGARLLDGLAG